MLFIYRFHYSQIGERIRLIIIIIINLTYALLSYNVQQILLSNVIYVISSQIVTQNG